MSEKINFTKGDFYQFRQWLCLNDKSLTWQGRYEKEFEEFWDNFFRDDLKLKEISTQFDYLLKRSKVGPIVSWFTWLRNRFLCFVFINKGVTIKRLSREARIEESEVGLILRDFFIAKFPNKNSYFEDSLIIANKLSKNREMTFHGISKQIEENFEITGSNDNEIMKGMEVTLYESWKKISIQMKKDFQGKEINLNKLKNKEDFRKILESFSKVFAVACFAFFLVWAIEYLNIRYEKLLSEEVSIYEPQFRWEDQGLRFVEADQSLKENNDNFALDIEDIENVDDSENFLGESLEDTRRESVESEVVLASVEALPKDFDVADIEKSEYEEDTGRLGYRDSRYGNTKVYRVMMKSSDTQTSREQLAQLIKQYKVTQVDNVKPGLSVPGGYYYNLYVPRSVLKEFMAKVKEVETSVIYESRTRARRNPPGKNKVFIWVKSI